MFNADQTWLETAAKITTGERNKNYGHPLVNFLRIAHRQSCTYMKAINARQVAQGAVDFKMAREQNGFMQDNWVDTMGYSATVERMDYRLREMGYETGIYYLDRQPGESQGRFIGRMFDLMLECEEYDLNNPPNPDDCMDIPF